MSLLLLGASLVGPGLALKSVVPYRFSLVSYLLGQTVFLFFYLSQSITFFIPEVLGFLAVSSAGLALAMRPAFLSIFDAWNRRVEPAHAYWLRISVVRDVLAVILSAPMGLTLAIVVIGRFDAQVAQLLPALVANIIYTQLNPSQIFVAGCLSGAVGFLLLLTYRMVGYFDLEDINKPLSARTSDF